MPFTFPNLIKYSPKVKSNLYIIKIYRTIFLYMVFLFIGVKNEKCVAKGNTLLLKTNTFNFYSVLTK